MKTVLFVNACMRGEESRTLALCRAFLDELQRALPVRVIEHDLRTMGLKSVNADVLAVKEPLCDARNWSHPLIAPALAFQQADMVVVGAPYWDLSFPSVLKVWVENMYVRNLTFRYEEDQPIGLCLGTESVYITTAGSPIRDDDWGAGYMKAVLRTLGLRNFTRISAEALDLASSDEKGIMTDALRRVEEAARTVAARLSSDRGGR